MSPAQRRAFAQTAVKDGLCSRRAACRILRLARSTFSYRGRPPTLAEEQLSQRLLALSWKSCTSARNNSAQAREKVVQHSLSARDAAFLLGAKNRGIILSL